MWRASGRKYQIEQDGRKETENKMKKVYEKPQVYMERFELAEHIAACSLQIKTADAYDCSVVNDRTGLVGVGAYISKPTCKIEFEQYCYSGGTG